METAATQQRPSPPAQEWVPALQSLIAGQATSYWKFYSFGLVERIGMVKAGLPARLLTTLANDMHVPRERLYGWLGIARTTANRKVKDDEVLSQDESERALGITRLVGQVQKIVSESGN